MSTLYIEEFTQVSGGGYPAGNCPSAASQTVAIGGTTAQSNAFSKNTQLIRVATDSICSIVVGGTNPSATTSNMRLAANQTEYFLVKPGDKLAVISNT